MQRINQKSNDTITYDIDMAMITWHIWRAEMLKTQPIQQRVKNTSYSSKKWGVGYIFYAPA